MKKRRIVVFLFSALASAGAGAHSPFGGNLHDKLPILLGAFLLLLLWLAYTWGARRQWPGWPRAMAFHGACLLAWFALFGPLDEWAEASAAAHMTQHMLMMVVIAPLWVLAQPLPQLAGADAQLARIWRPLLRLARHPMLAALLHADAIWFWHAPRFYVLALHNEWWHLVEHACFLLTAGIFWWAVLRGSQRNGPNALLALLFTLMHTGFLGALLTFAHSPLYGAERSLASQQLAGLIMWVVGGLPYLVAASWTGLRWFRQMVRRTGADL